MPRRPPVIAAIRIVTICVGRMLFVAPKVSSLLRLHVKVGSNGLIVRLVPMAACLRVAGVGIVAEPVRPQTCILGSRILETALLESVIVRRMESCSEICFAMAVGRGYGGLGILPREVSQAFVRLLAGIIGRKNVVGSVQNAIGMAGIRLIEEDGSRLAAGRPLSLAHAMA